MEGTCKGCKFWELKNHPMGLCKAHAPSPLVVKGTSDDRFTLVWPSTGSDDGCGEFTPELRGYDQ